MTSEVPRGLAQRSRTTEVMPQAGPPSGAGSKPPSRSEVSGKVAHLEEKLHKQERVNTYLMEQLARVESSLSKFESKGSLTIFDEKRLELLEQDQRRHDAELRKLEAKLSQSYSEYKGMDGKLRGMQRQEDNELGQLRNILQEKFHEDHKIHLKNKEKSQVLFSELVRLGENSEKNVEYVQNLSVSLEQRLTVLESRLNQGETAVATINTKNDSGVNMLIELAERVEKRVQMIEGALHSLNTEQQNDHKTIDRVETGTRNLQDEVKGFLRQLQSDIQHRLELKMSELLNKLLQEQEERLRNNQDLKYTFEVKDKIINEKIQFNRDEFRDRIVALESYMKTENQRRDEAMSHLQNSLESQMKSLYEAVKHEENSRMHSYNDLRDELSQMADATREAIEQYQQYQAATTNKMTEMMKIEIDCRTKAEKELKNLIQSTIKGLMQEISLLKETSEKNRLKLDFEIKEASSSFSEKADLLSRYIEEEVKRLSDLMRGQHDQTKGMVTTITESLKHTIITNEKNKAETNSKFSKIDRALTHIKSELARADHMNEGRIIYKMKELQANLESHLAMNSKVLEDRIETLAGMIDTSLGTFEKDILYNREVFSNLLNQLNRDMAEQHRLVCEDLGKLLGGLDALQNEIDSVGEETQEKLHAMEKQVSLIESQSTVMISTEKMMREHMLSQVTQDFEESIKEFESKAEKLEERLSEEEKIQQGNDDRNLENFAEISEQIKALVENIQQAKDKGEFEAAAESYFTLQDMVATVEANDIYERIQAVNLAIDAKEMESKGLEDMNLQLQAMIEKLREENKDMIQEAFERKVAKLQETMQKNNQAVWEEVVKAMSQHAPTTASLNSLSDRISQIANNASSNFRPQIRFA